MWKILGWALAVVGAVVVVRKAAPWVARQLREHEGARALPPGSAPEARLLPAGPTSARSGRGPRMVDCNIPGEGGPSPAGAPTAGYQSSPLHRWCYVVRPGDTAGSIAEAITGDSARYVEFLVANPSIAKRGKMGTVIGPDAWDFAEGAIPEGSKILVSQTMNAWIDQLGVAQGGYLPYPPDPREIHEVAGYASAELGDEAALAPPPPTASTSGAPAGFSDGFDYIGGVQ